MSCATPAGGSLPDLARAICDRHTGVGADGWLHVGPGGTDFDGEIHLFNADGSVTVGILIGTPSDRFEQELPELKRLLREATAGIAGITQALVEEKGTARD